MKWLVVILLFFLFGCEIEENKIQKEIIINKKYEIKKDIKIMSKDDSILIKENYLIGLEIGQANIEVVYKNDKYFVTLNVVEDFSLIENYLSTIKNEKIQRNIYIADTYYYNGYNSALKFLNEELNVKESLINKGSARPGIIRDIKWIVIHETANVNANALNHEKYLTNLALENIQSISWHYSIDDNYIIRHVPDNEVAYHAGDGLNVGGGNLNGIGIEINVNKGSDFIKSLHKTAKLVADLMIKYNLTMNSIKRHSDFANKNCPLTINNNGLFQELLSYVEAEYTMKTIYKDYSIRFLGIDKTGRLSNLNDEYMTIVTNLKTGYSKSI